MIKFHSLTASVQTDNGLLDIVVRVILVGPTEEPFIQGMVDSKGHDLPAQASSPFFWSELRSELRRAMLETKCKGLKGYGIGITGTEQGAVIKSFV